jgi:predicted  nucleic acid-binding Zn-ribbon protein
MRDLIIKRLNELTSEVSSLTEEKKAISDRLNDIEVRLHQLVGAIYEMQLLLNQTDQPSDSSEVSPDIER